VITRTGLSLLLLAALASACSTVTPEPVGVAPTAAIQLVTPTALAPEDLPFSEDGVPRVSVQVAKAALDSGQALIVDVRTSGAFEQSHAAGAISIQLGEVELNAATLPLDKDRWIITYCT
jgi:hypothetical protein